MKKLRTLTLLLIAIGTAGSLFATPVIVVSGVRNLDNDAFFPTSSVTILGSSPVQNGDAINLFGGMSGVEGDDALFFNAAVGTTYFVNWQTSAPVELSSYRITLSDDSPGTGNARAISELRLYSSPDAAFTSPVLLSTATISSPYTGAYGASNIAVYDSFPSVTAQFFRLEFVNASMFGPRIVEVDGNASFPVLANISTRLPVQTGDDVLIGGFILTGTQPKRVIVRAIGPSLPLAGALADPILELHGPNGFTTITNDNWRSDQEAEIIATTIQPSNDLESAIVATLPANGSAYTAIVRGVNNGTGIGLVEAYDLDRLADSRLANISTRGLVQTDDNVLIAGTIVLGRPSQRVLIRGIGPSLSVPGKLADPTLELRDGDGALLDSNDNWRSDQESEIMETGIPPTDDLEAAIISRLSGNGASYTAILRGVEGSTGVAVVEVYAID
jgi:hypothetical protein